MDLVKSGNRRNDFEKGVSHDAFMDAVAPRTTIIPGALDEPFGEGEENAFLRLELDSDPDEDTAIAQSPLNRSPSVPAPTTRQGSVPPPRPSMPSRAGAKDKWYLRVQLRKEHLADLWVRDLTPHNVLAWSDGMETWVPLLAVPELRDAIRSAQDKKTRDLLTQQPPASPPLPKAPLSSVPSDISAPSHRPPPVTSPSGRPATGPLPPPSLPPPALIAQQANLSVSGGTARPSSAPPPAPAFVAVARSSAPPPPAVVSTRPPVPRSVAPIAAQERSVPPPLPFEVEDELEDRDSELKTIPHASKVPLFANYAAPPVPAPVGSRPVAEAAVVAPSTISVAIDDVDQSRSKPFRLAALSPMAFHEAGKWTSLVNLERVLWLCAGISVATAASFAFRKSTQEHKIVVTAPVNSGYVAVTAGAPDVPSRSGEAARDAARDAANVEQLPLVGKGAGRTTATVRSSGAFVSARAPTESAVKSSGTGESSASAASKTSSTATRAAQPKSDGGFDPGQARRVLASAASRARGCASGPFSGSVQVTFSPSGFVQGASLSGLTGEGVRSGCVLRAFQEARVSPFSGAPVAVRKSFSF